MKPAHAEFTFTGRSLEGRLLRLGYRLSGGPSPTLDLEERLELPPELPAPDPTSPAVQSLLQDIHLAFGISYYKTSCPRRILVEGDQLDNRAAGFWDQLYTMGLGEFLYRNDLDPLGLVRFPGGGAVRPPVGTEVSGDRVLLLVGGGKDSAVAREVVRHAGLEVDLFSLGTAPWIQRSAAAMGDRHLVARRRLDPALFKLNEEGSLNGHVPVSALIAFVSTLTAMAGGYRWVVAANERSASEGSFRWRGMEVNHQWSKGIEFERAFHQHMDRRLTGAPVWFSLLRPLTEGSIGTLFAKHTRYFDSFTSCNANFRIAPGEPPPRWCGRCPKCVFVALILGPHLDSSSTRRIFGRDILADPENLPMVEALAGVRGTKPFECVGTPDEVKSALCVMKDRGKLPPHLAHVVRPISTGDALALVMETTSFSGHHRLPPAWEQRLHAYLGR